MGILDTLKKAIDSAGKAATKVREVAVDSWMHPMLESVYKGSEKRLELEDRARAQGTPISPVAKAASYVPLVSLATNPYIESRLDAMRDKRKYAGVDAISDALAGGSQAIGPAWSAITPVASATSGVVGKLSEEVTGTNYIDELSKLASVGSEKGVKKIVDLIPGLTDTEREKIIKSGSEAAKLAIEILAAKGGAKAGGKLGAKGAIGQGVSQAVGTTAADAALAAYGASDDEQGPGVAKTSMASMLANAIPTGPGGKGKRGKPDLAETVRKTKVVSPDAPEAAVVAKSFAKEGAARKAAMPFKEAQANIELAAEKATGVVSPTRANPAYAEFWKAQDAAKAVSEAPKKETAPTEDDYYAGVEEPKVEAPIKAMLDKAVESKKNPAETVVEDTNAPEPVVAKTDAQVVSDALKKAVKAKKLSEHNEPSYGFPDADVNPLLNKDVAPVKTVVAKVNPAEAPVAAATEAPVAPFEIDTEKPKVKPQSYDATKSVLDAKDVDAETVKTARPVKGTTSILGTTSARTLFNKVRVKGKDGLERGLGDVLVAIVDGRYNEAMRNMEASGLKTDADVAIANYMDDNRPFRESIDGMIGAMRGPKLRDVKVGPESSALTYGEWADVFDAERNSQDRSWMAFGDNARQDAARDIAVLDAMYDRLSKGPSAALKARDAYAKGVVGDTLMNVKIAAKNAADSMGAAGGDWMVQNNLLADFKLDPEYRHDYVPESMFQRYKKSLLASGKLDKESAKALENMDYQRFVSNDYDLASLSDSTVKNLSPLLQDKKNATFLHMPGDFARAVHQADRIAALKQNKSAYDLANGVQATPQGEGIKNVWKGGMKGLLSLGDQTGKQILGETPYRAVNAAGNVVHNFISPFLYIFGKGKLLAQAAASGAATTLVETAMNPVRALVNSLTQNPLKQLGLTPGNKLSAVLRESGLIERPVNSRASGFEKAKSFGFAFGGKPFDQIAKTFAAYKAIQEIAGKNMTVDQAAAWFSRKMKDGTPSERAQVMSDVGSVVSRISDHTTGARSGQPWLNSVWMGTLKSFQRNQQGRYLNAIQNSYDALLAKESPKLSSRERARAVRELAYPAAVLVGGPLMAGAALLGIKEAARQMGVQEDELPEDDVLIETGFNTYNMSTANGYGPMALEFLLNDAVSTLRPSGAIAIVDKAIDVVGAVRKLMDGDVRGAATELLKGGIASRLADTSLGKDVKGYERGYGADVASRLGLPTTSAANANLFRSQFARDFYGDRSYLAAIENAGKKVLPKLLQDFVGNKYSQPGSAEEKAEMEDLKTAAAQEFISFVKSGERKNFTQFLRDFLPPAVKYDPVDFAEIMAGRQIDRVEEGGAIARLLELMPQSMRGVAYVGDVGEYFRKLGETDPQALEQFAGAVAGLVAEAKKNAAEGRLNKDVEGDFRKGFVDPASSSVVAEFTGEDPASTDPSNKFSNLARKIVGDLKGERDQAVVREGVAKLDSLVARAKADPNFWKAVGNSMERVVSEAMFGKEGGQILDFVKANGEDFPALDEALRGRYKYLSGPAGDAAYVGAKPEAEAETKPEPTSSSGTKKPTDITSLLNSAIWSASANRSKGDKKNKAYVPVPSSKKSASRPSTPSPSSPSGRISEALYKAIGSRPRK
jgi:hypothetical protein